ncbi:MAG: type II secretion system F family protein [Nitrososphaerota archaeon]
MKTQIGRYIELRARETAGSVDKSLTGFTYRYFYWSGRILSRVFYSGQYLNIDSVLDEAGMKIYPEAYVSLIGFLFILSIIATIPLIILTGLLPLAFIPLIIPILGYIIPKVKARDRASKLDMEVPFAGAYISVMATGGLSPYESLKKLRKCELLPNISKVVKHIEVDVKLKGLDPVAALENSAEKLPSREYKDLILGYAHTLRTGGDVIHYLLIKTETMFRDLAAKIKAFGERAAMLMETYVAIIILSSLSLSVIFMTSIAFESFWQGGFTAENYLLYSYLLVPTISILFIYLTDLSSFQEPLYETGPYKVFAASLPVMITLLLTMFFPFLVPELKMPITQPMIDFVVFLRGSLGLEKGYEAALGLSIALIIGTIPAVIAHSYFLRRGREIVHDVTNFLRDLTEARKTGASPESCIVNLSRKSYGKFGKYLKVAARQIRWGLPFKVIYETFKSKIRSWLALINIYILVDAIEVGGGSPETLETLTRFSEMLSSLEKEKKALLRPLAIMPYIGAGILLFSTIIFLSYMRFVLYSFARQPMPFSDFVTLMFPPIILQAYLTGLVTGKITSGLLSTGFRHATILTVAAVLLMVIMNFFTITVTW